MVVWCQMLVKIMYMKKGGVQDRRSLLLFVDFALFRGPSFPPLFPHDAAERGKDISMLQKSQNLPVHHIRRRSSLYTSLSLSPDIRTHTRMNSASHRRPSRSLSINLSNPRHDVGALFFQNWHMAFSLSWAGCPMEFATFPCLHYHFCHCTVFVH